MNKKITDLLNIKLYDYKLPKDLIAQKPSIPPDTCKLLHWNWEKITDLRFKDIINFLSSNDVLFFNNSKVIKARILFSINNEKSKINNHKKNDLLHWNIDKNGKMEILFLKKLGNNIFEALVRPWKKFKIWKKIKLWKYIFEILDYTQDGRIIKLHSQEDIFNVLEKIGILPLPPYIEYSKDKEKPYQPIIAQKKGSIASPTASLHFTSNLLKQLKNKWIKFIESTLHIWLWTFKIIDTENIQDYQIHSETIEILSDIFDKIAENKLKWKKIIAVWTTSTRILESLPYLYKKIKNNTLKIKYYEYWDKITNNITYKEINKFINWNALVKKWIIIFDTKLYIYPWFKYKIIDKLITNFHLPRSSLLLLVTAFMGYENMMKCYHHAIKNWYKFFSFGDAMFIEGWKLS